MGLITLVKVLEVVDNSKGRVLNWYIVFFHFKWRNSIASLWQYADLMSSKPAQWPRLIASLICLRVIILNFVQVMNWWRGFRFIMKCPIPFFLGWHRGKWRTLCSQDLASLPFQIALCQFPRTSWLPEPLGYFYCTFMMVLKWKLQLKHNRCPCTMPNTMVSWVIPVHSSINSCRLLPIGRTDCHGL